MTENSVIVRDGALPSTELKEILARLESLRSQVVDAWQERAVMLTRSEQDLLRVEITHTCEILSGLVLPR